MRHSGLWGAVCSDKWDDAAANVTCRRINRSYLGGIALGNVRTVDMPFWLRDASCAGNESTLEQCKYTQWGEPVFFCSAAYVLCYRTSGCYVIFFLFLFFSILDSVEICYEIHFWSLDNLIEKCFLYVSFGIRLKHKKQIERNLRLYLFRYWLIRQREHLLGVSCFLLLLLLLSRQ